MRLRPAPLLFACFAGAALFGLAAVSPAFAQEAPAKRDAPAQIQRPGRKSSTAEQAKPTIAEQTGLRATPLAEIATEAELERRVAARARLLRLGDEAGADVELELLDETRRAIGAQNVAIASAMLIREANQALAAGRTARAIDLAERATRISPAMPAAHWARVHAYVRHDFSRLGQIGSVYWDFLVAKFAQFRNQISVLSNAVGFLLLALFATTVVFTTIQVTKYLRYPSHDLSTHLPQFIGPMEVTILFLILLSLPIVLGWGFVPSLVLGLTIIMAYQMPVERIISIVALVLIGTAPGVLYLASPLVLFHGSAADAMETAMSQAFVGDAEERLRTQLRDNADDFGSALILAQRSRVRGDLEVAELHYRKAIVAEPTSAIARNNLGVVLYLLGRREASIATFREAANAGTLVEPLLNLTAILADASQFGEANEMLERARRIDPKATETFTRADTSVPTKAKLRSAAFGQEFLWTQLADVKHDDASGVAREIWSRIGGNLPPVATPLLAMVLGVLGITLSRNNARTSIPCTKCGIPARRDAPAQYCEQCQSVFLTAIAVEPALRLQKEGQVRSIQRRRRILERTLCVIAGAGQIFAHNPVRGVILLVLFFLAVGNLVWPHGLGVHAWDVASDASAAATTMVVSGTVGVALALISLIYAVRNS